MSSYYTQALQDHSTTELPPVAAHRAYFLAGVTAVGLVALAGLTEILQLGQQEGTAFHVTTVSTSTYTSSALPHVGVRPSTRPDLPPKQGWMEGSNRATLLSTTHNTRSAASTVLRGTKQAVPKDADASLGQMVMGIGAFLSGLSIANLLKKPAKQDTKELHTGSSMTAVTAGHKYKLMYFDARAAAEVARLLFAIAGVPYEDYRYKFNFETPGDFRTVSMPEFKADKASGALDLNMGRLPILEVDGVPIGQSKAIERYLAKQFGFFGDNDIEGVRIDMICEHVRDIKDGYRKLLTMKDTPEKVVAMHKWYAEELPGWCHRLERCLGSGRWAVGSKFSLADINIWALLTDTFNNKEAAAAAYKDCPHLKNICANVEALEGVQTWSQRRPPTLI